MIRDWLTGRDNALVDATFAVDGMDAEVIAGANIPPEVYGLASYSPTVPNAAPVTRKQAMTVGAVKRARDLVPGTLGTLPIDVIDPQGQSIDWPLLVQPEKDVARSVTMTRTFEDAWLYERAWWRVTEFAWNGYPKWVKRIDPRRVTVDDELGVVYIDGKKVPSEELIRFEAPTDGLLTAAARAIRTCLNLDDAAARAANGVPPVDYFENTDGFEPDDDQEIVDMLDDWNAARRERRTGYIPAGLAYKVSGWSPKDLMLPDARAEAVLEIARHAGIDPEEVGVSTTSRTYANQFDRRKSFLDFTLGLFRQAFEDRLSMNDVTPRGYSVKFNLSAFLRSDDKTRMETYEIGKRVGAIVTDEIRDLEDRPPLTAAQRAEITAQPAPTREAPVSAPAPDATAFGFDAADGVTTFDSPAVAQFSVDRERRIIRGLAVPYGQVGRSRGNLFQFSQGSLALPADVTRIKILIGHDFGRAVGKVIELDDRADGLYFAASIASGPAGDEALSMADEGVWDGVSIGVGQGGRFATRGGVNHAVAAPVLEFSLTPLPSFTDARVHAVAASAAPTTEGDPQMTPEQIARLAALRAQDTLTQPEANELTRLTGLESADAPAADAASFSAVSDAIAAGFAQLSLPPRETVDAATETTQVDEAPLYRFDGLPGQRSLSDDMRDALRGDSDARQSLDEFFNETFAVSTGNTAALNPTQNRPDLYVGALHYNTPLWDMVTNGSITDKTPFTIPKFVSAGGLVDTHVEGVEPDPGTFVATSQTITPGALSGKVEIHREVLDQGGSPQADQIIWNEMLAAYYEAREVRIAALLATVGTAEVNLAGAVDDVLVSRLKSYLAGLQFVRGGNRFTAFAADGMLFPALIDATDADGRPLLPVHGPTNADGSVSGAFDSVAVGSQRIRAAWALGTGNAAKSYSFVPSSVYAWSSAPRKFQFEYQVKSVDIAIWGYSAEAVTRASDVRPIDYTTSDDA